MKYMYPRSQDRKYLKWWWRLFHIHDWVEIKRGCYSRTGKVGYVCLKCGMRDY